MSPGDYEAVVYDLDGTLVHLAVDWASARRAVASVLSDRGVAVDGADLWDLRERGAAAGHGDAVERRLAGHEREGARTGRALPIASELPHDVPVGVCSLNCAAACHDALRTHGLAEHVDAVVGRDSHEAVKPQPGPLLAVVDALGAAPEHTVFVGDSERDRETARRAGTAFAWAREW